MVVSAGPQIKSGERARLLPVVADTSREGRVTSSVLATLPRVPGLASALLGSLGVRVGRRCRIEAFTEVVLKNESGKKDRPDGLVVVDTGRGTFTMLVEVKVGKASLEEDQVCRYLELANDNRIDAVLTISNQFVARADHPPLSVPKPLLKKTKLFHWPWMWVLTQCQLLQLDGSIEDVEQRFLLDELVRFLEHPSTGVEGFTQMAKEWKGMVRSVGAGATPPKGSPDAEQVVASWLEEQRDLCLRMSRRLGQAVTQPVERRLRDDPVARLNQGIEHLSTTKTLEASLRVPDAASDIDIRADLRGKSVTIGMKVRAPEDKKSTKARVNWLLRMVETDDARIDVRAHWPSKVPATQRHIAEVRKEPTCLQASNGSLVPGWFEIVFVEELGARFSGPRTFIEDLERVVPEFYDLVGQHLKQWQAPPPKPVSKPASVLPEIVDVNPERDEGSDDVVGPGIDAPTTNDRAGEPVYALFIPPESDARSASEDDRSDGEPVST